MNTIVEETLKRLRINKNSQMTNDVTLIDYAINAIEYLQEQLELQTALAQNGQSAIDTVILLTDKLRECNKEKDLLQESITQIIKQGVEDLCLLCKHYIKCEPKTCSDFISGDSVKDAKGNIIEWKWTCQDFNCGDCPKLENTPCYQCYKNDFSGFENIKGSQSH